LLDKINGIGSKLDKARKQEDRRYNKVCMTMVALKMALPVGNPHNIEVAKLVDDLAEENGG